MKRHWQWTSATGYAGGAPPREPIVHGIISVEDDGSICVSPEDGYYSGKLTPVEAFELARAVLRASECADVVKETKE